MPLPRSALKATQQLYKPIGNAKHEDEASSKRGSSISPSQHVSNENKQKIIHPHKASHAIPSHPMSNENKQMVLTRSKKSNKLKSNQQTKEIIARSNEVPCDFRTKLNKKDMIVPLFRADCTISGRRSTLIGFGKVEKGWRQTKQDRHYVKKC